MDALAVVVAAVIAALGGIWLDRRFQEIDRRRDLYLEVLDYLDNMGVMIKEHIVADTAAYNATLNAMERQINSMSAKLSLLASDAVRTRFREYRKTFPKAMDVLERPSEEAFTVSVARAFISLEPEREALVTAMRTDLRKRPWRRKV